MSNVFQFISIVFRITSYLYWAYKSTGKLTLRILKTGHKGKRKTVRLYLIVKYINTVYQVKFFLVIFFRKLNFLGFVLKHLIVSLTVDWIYLNNLKKMD